jgi:hypothetical protein
LIMKGLRRDLAAAEARVLAGDAGAAGDAEFLFLSITRRLRDRDTIRREVIDWIFRVHDGTRPGGRSGERGGARGARLVAQPSDCQLSLQGTKTSSWVETSRRRDKTSIQ